MEKILFVISGLDCGGTERAVSNLLTHFPEKWDIDILLSDDKTICYPYKGNVISLNIEQPRNPVNLVYQFRMFCKRTKKLIKLKRENNYVACVSFLDSSNIANILSGNQYCKTIISIRSNLLEARPFWIYRYIVIPLVKIFYKKADKIVTVSKGIEEDMSHIFHLKPEKITSIINGFDFKEISRKAMESFDFAKYNLSVDDEIVINAGRMNDAKGQGHLIRAFNEVLKRNPKTKLVILGEGSLKDYLERLVEAYGLKDKVIFPGFSSNPFQWFRIAKLFVFPSIFEGFPNALAEAMCCGVPCIATDFRTGVREIMDPKNRIKQITVKKIEYAEYGIISPVCDGVRYTADDKLTQEEKILAEAINCLINNVELQEKYRKKSVERGQQMSIEEVIQQWVKVILS